jgi:hypothetical protein
VAVIHDPRGKLAFQAEQAEIFATALRCLGALVLGAALSHAVAAEDPYLQALESEAGKIDSAAAEAGPSAAAISGGAAQAPTASRSQFEATLQARYTGTFEFYRKLPERSRQEIFEHYQHGASIEDVRKKIIDRLLQH